LVSDFSANPVLASITTASTTAEFNISELGRDYVFEIKAVDREGLGSDVSTTTVSAPDVSIEDLNYLLINQQNYAGNGSRSVGQIFRPSASGVLDSIKMGLGTSGSGWAEMHAAIYEWNGNASSSVSVSKGALLTKSGTSRITSATAYPSWSTLVWNFDNILLEADKYYYLTIETESATNDAFPSIYWKCGNGDYIDGDAWGDSGKINDFYLVINAVKDGIISMPEPINNQVYYDSNLNYNIKYLEPVDKKYGSIVIETSNFYTGELIDGRTIILSDSEQTIGWREISGSLGINRAGYFKITASLSDSIKSEINFSVFGAEPPEGKLLYQNNYGNNGVSDDYFSGQVFRPTVSGWTDSLSIIAKAICTNVIHGYNYLSVYEWNGNGNDLEGSSGALLATTGGGSSVCSSDFMEISWGFSGDGVYLDSNKYYFLTLNKVTNGGQVPHLSMKMSDNGSLIDGRLIGQGVNQGDLYLIVNKKAENPSL